MSGATMRNRNYNPKRTLDKDEKSGSVGEGGAKRQATGARETRQHYAPYDGAAVALLNMSLRGAQQ